MSKKVSKIKTPAQLLPFDMYDTCLIFFSNGIDSTGAIFEMLKVFPKEKILLVYLDTGLEHKINEKYLQYVSKELRLRNVILKHPMGFKGILLQRKMFPDAARRYCTAYLKTQLSNTWIINNRHLLGTKVLIVSGERWDESKNRANLLPVVYHHTHLWTQRVADFTCHWYKPVLAEEKGKMFEYGKLLRLEPHPCYVELPRCSCIACFYMSDRDIVSSMKMYPEEFQELIAIEKSIKHTWKKGKSLEMIWNNVCDLVAPPDQGYIA